MPVLDLIDFINIVQTPGQGRGISLFLFQAVMFAGSSHCDIKFLRGLGFLTRKAARRALYLKTKVNNSLYNRTWNWLIKDLTGTLRNGI